MVRTYRNPQGGSLGGMFDGELNFGYQRPRSRPSQVFENPKSGGGFSSSSEEFASPVPNPQQMNPNHQFSPTLANPYYGRRSQGINLPNPYASSPQLNQPAASRFRQRADPMGNIFILPRQLDVGLCHNCQHLFGGNPQQGQSVDYDDLLNQKRKAELQYRNSSDPFAASHGMRGSNSETFLTRVAEPLPPQGSEDLSLANGLNDLSNVLARLQNNVGDTDDIALTSISYPNSAQQIPAPMGVTTRQSRSAPQNNGDPFGFNGPNSIMPDPSQRRAGPGDGPAYGRAKMQLERDRIRLNAQNGSLSDPLELLRSQRSHNQGTNGSYSPSILDGTNNRRGADTKDPYLKDLEAQIAERDEMKRRENQSHQDWWEKRKDPPFVVQPPSRPHPSQPEPTAAQRPDPRVTQMTLQDELRMQMEMKKIREAEEKAREREEEAKLERRIQEQQERMKAEFEEEQNKKKAKEQAKMKRQEEMARRQQELQKEAERQRKEAAERKFQERQAEKRRQKEEEQYTNHGGGSSRGSTPSYNPPRSNSPPLPAHRNASQANSSNNSEFESGSIGLSSASEDDQENAALSQLSKMRSNLEKKTAAMNFTEEDDDRGHSKGKGRRSSIWEGLAEV